MWECSRHHSRPKESGTAERRNSTRPEGTRLSASQSAVNRKPWMTLSEVGHSPTFGQSDTVGSRAPGGGDASSTVAASPAAIPEPATAQVGAQP